MVREEGAYIQITERGEVIALLLPVRSSEPNETNYSAWEDIDTLAAEIGARWPEVSSAIESISEGRR